MSSKLAQGTVIANRFTIERVAGSGGMGTVYKARDTVIGNSVAVKILNRPGDRSLDAHRFRREGKVLAALQHPGIVSYVDSGETPDGLRYLAMEWLSGEDLASRMERGELSVAEVRALLEEVAAALAAAHQLDVVHRDIKPSNLFLCTSPRERVVLLDFGVAHYDRALASTAITRTGAIVGTLHYMAPEQAAGSVRITPAADIYALGRVAYQALAGHKYRPAAHAAAALARVMFEEEQELSVLCPWVPAALSRLITHLLQKDPAQRPQNGTELLAELAALGALTEKTPDATGQTLRAAAPEERHLYSIVLAVSNDSSTIEAESSGSYLVSSDSPRSALEATLVRHRAQPRWLLDGSLLLTLLPSESAHDQAAHAARCALIIKAEWPDAKVAVATGRGQIFRHNLVGEVVDRAARLLRAEKLVANEHAQVEAAAASSVWVDALSATLLERRFALLPFENGALLTGELVSSEDARPVLGVLLPCFGREQELTILDAMLSRCTLDGVAQAVLATAPPGHGKTRLRQEFQQRLRRRSHPALSLLGAGELLSFGTPYGVIGSALRRFFEIDLTADPQACRQKLFVAAEQLLGTVAAGRFAPYLAELLGLRVCDESNAELRAARGDPALFTTLLSQAFIKFLDALCQRTAVVLVLEDLHWGDLLTVNLVAAALKELESRPLMVIALGRPEVKESFPLIREWPKLTELPLCGLGKNASENFVRFVLGSTIAPETVKIIVEQAEGNALLLEELIRAHGSPSRPETAEAVQAILQARIEKLGPKTRLLLCKASVFGLRFWRGGLLSMQDPAHSSVEDFDSELIALVQAEFIILHRASCFARDIEYSFRHILLRDAAYALLTDEQKQRAHRQAGQYLAEVGEPDAMVLAEHFSRSDDPHRAFPYFLRAAARALDSNELSRIRACIKRAHECQSADEAPELLGELFAIAAISHYRAGELDACISLGADAIARLPPGGNRWSQMMYSLLAGSMMSGHKSQFFALANRFTATEPTADARTSYVETCGVMLTNLCLFGQRDAVRQQIARISLHFRDVIAEQPGARAWFYFGQNRLVCLLEGDPFTAWQHAKEAVLAASRTGNPRWMSIMQVDAAIAARDLGSPNFLPALRASLEVLRTIPKELAPGYAVVGAAVALASYKEHKEEALSLTRSVLVHNTGNAYFAGMAQLALAEISATSGNAEAAEQEAKAALECFGTMLPMQLVVSAVLLRALLAQGKIAAARSAAEEGLARLHLLGESGLYDLRLRLAAIEAFIASDDKSSADTQLDIAFAVLQSRAARIPDVSLQKHYLENVVENARIMTLARERLGKAAVRS